MKQKNQKFKFRLLPVMIFTGIVFLLVRVYSYEADGTDMFDLFCHFKSSAIVFTTVWAALTMAFLLITGQMKIRRTKFYIPMAVYTLSVVVSYFVSSDKSTAWLGSINRFEGTKVILCYMFMLFYTINVIDDIKDAMMVLNVTFVGVIIACLIGLSQFVGHDLLLSDAAGKIIADGMQVGAQFEKGLVYQTVYNMNYVGMYLSLIVPVLIVLLVHAAKNRSYVNLSAAAVLLILIALNVIGAGSMGGILGIGTAVVIMVIIMTDKSWVRITVSGLSVAAAVVILILSYNNTDNRKSIEYFETGQDMVTMSMNGNEISVIYDRSSNGYDLKDSDGKILKTFCFDDEEGIYQIENKRFAGELIVIPFDKDGDHYVIMDVRNEKFMFKFLEDGTVYVDRYGKEFSLHKIESFGFANHLNAGSGRGYIWSRTIPLLKNHIFAGSGADTFISEFPQDDYAGKYSVGLSLDTIIDKPHNMFLQMIVCTGGISFIAFLAIIGIMIFGLHNTKKSSSNLIRALVSGIIGFAIAGLFNDSSVCTMPVFYGLLGITVALIIFSKNRL